LKKWSARKAATIIMIDNTLLKPGERFDDLQLSGYHVIQNPDKFSFGMDAVLLSGFIKVKKGAKVYDMCTGNGIIPILAAAKTKADKIYAVEIQPEVYDMAARSIKANGLEGRICLINGDIKESVALVGRDFDAVTCNPPYMPVGTGIINPDDAKAVARHEVFCTLSDVCAQAAAVLKEGGHFFMVHKPQRLTEIIEAMAANGLEAKRLRFVHATIDKKPSMVLIDAVKGGGRELNVEPPIIIYDEEGKYSEYMRTEFGF